VFVFFELSIERVDPFLPLELVRASIGSVVDGFHHLALHQDASGSEVVYLLVGSIFPIENVLVFVSDEGVEVFHRPKWYECRTSVGIGKEEVFENVQRGRVVVVAEPHVRCVREVEEDFDQFVSGVLYGHPYRERVLAEYQVNVFEARLVENVDDYLGMRESGCRRHCDENDGLISQRIPERRLFQGFRS